MRLLFNDDSAAGAGGPSGPSTEPTAAPPQTAAPAAATVATAQTTEETELLRAELEKEKALRKQREQEHASVTDEFQRYKDATEARASVPVRRAPVKEQPSARRFLRR